MTHRDPFTALGISPTLDREVVKRAYFDAVRRNPPHVNPHAFRTIRGAYEALSDDARLMRAWLASPLDTAEQLALWNARFSTRIEAACATLLEQRAAIQGLDLLIDRCAGTRIR